MRAGAVVIGVAAAAVALLAPGTASAAHKTPAAGSTPAAGICGPAHGRVATVALVDGMPMPRCWQVRPGQELRVRNATRRAVTVKWAAFAKVHLQPHAAVTYREPFARYLQPGDHDAAVSLYHGGGFEILLPSHKPPVALTSAG